VLNKVGMQNYSTQCGKLLALLDAAKGRWVSAVELSKISLEYSARIQELRKHDLRIENRVERIGRIKHGYFRLVTKAPPKPAQSTAVTPPPDADELFPNVAPAAHLDLG
jgi:hypothetical protein